jgi:Cdc6-like AAA superfamily ATPase
VIENARVLTEGFVPTEVSHRNAELNALSTALEPAARDEPAEHVLLFGPTGTGKTCLARYMLRRLEEQAFVTTAYVNCWEAHTRFRALHAALDEIGSTVGLHPRSTPTADLLERIRERVDEPKSERMLRNYLSKMEHYNLVETEGETRWRRYRAR